MAQDRDSGAAGRAYGLRIGARIAELLGATKVSAISNEIIWNDRRAVIKAAAPATDSIGVTALMLSRLDDVYGALETDTGDFEMWRLDPAVFVREARDSPSARNRGADTRLVRRSSIARHGTLVRTFTKAEIER